MKHYIHGSIVLLAAFFLFIGCSISTKELIPNNTFNFNQSDKTIRVVNVQGAQKPFFGGPAMVTNEQFKEALVITLKKSNLFREVSTDKHCDVDLYAEIVAHGQAENGGVGLDYTSVMVVEYWLIETKNNKEIWRQGFNSRHKVTLAEAFSGATRTLKAQEGSVRKNLTQLIETLSSLELH